MSELVCTDATGAGNFQGLCGFACNWGTYCPWEACVCRGLGTVPGTEPWLIIRMATHLSASTSPTRVSARTTARTATARPRPALQSRRRCRRRPFLPSSRWSARAARARAT
ncbi:hypothetical protein V8F06_011697 [Rhypophila decipiens]